jgi:hypothetical protein
VRVKSVSWPDVLFVPFLHGIFRSDGFLSLAFLVLASATLSGAHSVIIALAQELVASRTSTASHFVSPFARGAPHPQSDSQTGERIATYLWMRTP